MVIIEFSLSQKAFHRTTPAEMIKNNFNMAMERKQTDYLPIGVFDTDEEADNFVDLVGNSIKDYKMYHLCPTGQTIVMP